MSTTCSNEIKFNPFGILDVLDGNNKTGKVGLLNQKGALDDRGTFYQMLSKPINEDEKVNNIIRILKKVYSGQYYTDESIADKILDFTIQQLSKRIEDFTCDKDLLLEQFENNFKEANETINDNPQEDQLDDDDIQLSDRTVDAAMEYYFAKAPGAQTSIHEHFKTSIRKRLYVNLEAGTISHGSDVALNRGLYDYQIYLYKIIANYVNQNTNSSFDINLYGDNDRLSSTYNLLMQEAFKIIKSKRGEENNSDSEHNRLLNSGWRSIQNITFNADLYGAKIDKEALDYYNFVEAFYLLKYFDNNYTYNFGNNIYYSPHNRNVPSSKYSFKKYSASIDKRGRHKGWNKNDEDRNGFEEQDRFSLGLLESFPMVSYSKFKKGLDVEHSILSKNLEYITLTHVFSKIKRFCSQNKITTNASKDSNVTSTNELFVSSVLDRFSTRSLHNILSILFKEGDYNHSKNNILETLKTNGVLEEEEINMLFGLYLCGYNTDRTIREDIIDIIDSLKNIINPSPACKKLLDTFDMAPFASLKEFISSNCPEFKNLSDKQKQILIKYKGNPFKFGNSIIKLENNERSKKFNSKYLIYSDCLTGLMDRVIELEYMSVDYDKSTGELEIKRRKKWNDNFRIHDFIESVNSHINSKTNDDRKTLIDKYSITQNGDESYIITINSQKDNEIKVKITKNDKYNMFSSYNTIEILTNKTNNYQDIVKYFEDFDFSENYEELQNENSEIYAILNFLKDFIGYDFLNLESSQILYLYKLRHGVMFKELLNNGFKAAIANHALYSYDTAKDNSIDFPEWLYSRYQYKNIFQNLGEYNKLGKFVIKNNSIIKQLKDSYFLNIVSKSEHFADNLVEAESQFRGVATRSTSTNYAGNKEQNGRTAFLGGQIQDYISETRRQYHKYIDDRSEGKNFRLVSASNLLFTQSNNNRSLIKGFIMSSDIQSEDGTVVKSIKQLNDQELLFHNIFYNFYGCLQSSDENIHGNMLIQPTTYSDKGSIITYLIDGTTEVNIGNKKYNLSNLSDNDSVEILNNTISKFYQDIAYNIVQDFVELFPDQKFIQNSDDLIKNVPNLKIALENINNYLSRFGENSGLSGKELMFKLMGLVKNHNSNLPVGSRKIELLEDEHISIYNGKLGINPLLYHYITYLHTPEGFTALLKQEKINFLNSILKSNLYIPVDDLAVKNALSLLSNEEDWIEDGMLVIAKQKLSDGTYRNIVQQGNELSINDNIIINPLLNRFFNSNTVLSVNLRNILTGSEIAHPLSKTDAYKKYTLNTQLSKLTGTDLSKSNIIQLKQYIDSITNDQIKNQALQIYNNTLVELESIAGAEGAQLKRNSIIPATGQFVLQKTINGVSSSVKVAVLEDIQAFVNQFDGVKDNEDSQDGSDINCPLFTELINRSLQAQAVGVDMKPIWHHYNYIFGSESLKKYAAFTITNLRMLQSLSNTNCDVSLYDLFKKMTNLQWRKNGVWQNSKQVSIDLVNGKRYGKNRYGEPSTEINFSQDILTGGSLKYGIGQNYKEIINLGKQKFDGIADEIYYTEEKVLSINGSTQSKSSYKVFQLFDNEGNEYKFTENEVKEHINDITKGKLHTINSLFELHCALGGIMCVEYNEQLNKFVPSENNIKYVVNYMNIVSSGPQLTDNNAKLSNGVFKNDFMVDQDSYYQPLKEMMISCCTNSSAMKNGRANTNSSKNWSNNEELNYMVMSTRGFCIQQDSDHIADESELTEPTQVMTALAQGGYLHPYANQIYNAIGKLSLLAAKTELSTVEEFIEKFSKAKSNDSKRKALNELYDIVGRIVLNNLSSNNKDKDLSTEICSAIKSKFGLNPENHFVEDTFLIPFSDPSIYGHFFPTIISVINSKGIRRKNSGSGMVMAPSYSMFQIFEIGGKKYTLTDIINRVSNNLPFLGKNSGRLTATTLKQLVQTELISLQSQEQIFNYNAFDLGDRILIHGVKKGIIDKNNLFGPNGEINWDYFEQILNSYHNNQPDSKFAKGRTTLATRQEKHFEGEKNTLNHIKFVTQSMLDLFEGKYDVDLPFVSEARASLQNQKDLMVLAAMFHDTAKPYRHGDIHGWESADILRDILGVDYNNRLAEWAIRHHMSMPFSHKAEFSLSNPEAIEVAKNMARDAKRMGIDEETAINAFVLINASDVINGREITVEDNWAKKAKDKGSTKYGDDISVKAVLTIELKEKVDLLKKAFDEIKDEDFGNPEYNYNYQERFDYKSFPEGGGRLPILHNVGTSIYINSIDKFYFVQDKNWAALSSNQRLLNKYGITHEKLAENGLDQTIANLRQNPNNNQNELLTLMTDDILQLYNCSELKYQKDIIKGRDLAPTRIQFEQDGLKKSIYHIPIIKAAFTNTADPNIIKDGKIIKPVMDALMGDLKQGFYYDNYILDENNNVIGSDRHDISNLVYLPPETIVSNMTASKFGLHFSETLQEAQEKINFNINKYILGLKKYPNNIDFRLLTRDNNHTYIKLSKVPNSREYEEVKFSDNIPKRILNDKSQVYPKYYQQFAVNKNNEEMFETTRFVFMKDFKINDNGEIIDNNGEKVKSNNYIKINNEVYRRFNFLKKYNYINRDDKINTLYVINQDEIIEMSNLLSKNSEEFVRDFISDIIVKLYSQEQYLGFDFAKSFDKSLLKNKSGIINKLKEKHPEINEYCEALTNLIKAKEPTEQLKTQVNIALRKSLENYKQKLLTSFEISKFLISSRIPAQTLQSFMPMEIVGYTQMSTNVTYVSAIQTFLQGSDYDIDKAYMLTHFFDNNGMYATWSPLVNLSSLSTFEASSKLPIPQKVKLYNVDTEFTFSTKYFTNAQFNKLTKLEKESLDADTRMIKENAIEITEELLAIQNSTSEEDRISNLANLIDKVDNHQHSVYVNKDKTITPICLYHFDNQRINQEDANKILNEIQMHEDYELSETLKEKAIQNANTAKMTLIIKDLANVNSAHQHIEMNYVRDIAKTQEAKTGKMTLWNIANILHMQYENQIGKNVIGIAANGEKGYFTLYYYFTECFKRIMENDINSTELNIMTTFNKRFNHINNGENITRIANLNKLYLNNPEQFKFEVDQMISQLLSAATDNAKELILAKINAGADLAKIYFYGLILGIDLADLASFMTSPVVDLIALLAKPSMFDLDRKHISLEQVIKMITEGDYLFYNYIDQDLLNKINYGLKSNKNIKAKLIDGREVRINSLNEFCNYKNQNLISETLYQFLEKNSMYFGYEEDLDLDYGYSIFNSFNKKPVQRLSQFVEGTSKKIFNVISQYQNKEEFISIINDFKMLLEGADELTQLTNVYLNTNQGIPTTINKYQNKLDGITKTIKSREHSLEITNVKGDNRLEQIKNIILKANPQLSYIRGQFINDKMNYNISDIEYIDSVLEAADKLGIIQDFNYEKWIRNPFYREVTKHYYNYIKSTFNIFHFLEIHPQYNANFQLLGVSYEMTRNICYKSYSSELIHRKIIARNKYWDYRNNKYIISNLTSHIIREFLSNNTISLNIDPTWSIIGDNWEENPNSGETQIVVDDYLGYSNFKYVLEKYIIPNLKKGTFTVMDSTGKEVSINDNDFIKGLTQKVKFNRPYYALDVDVSQSRGSASAVIKSTEYKLAFMDLKNYIVPGFKMNKRISQTETEEKQLTLQDLFVLYNLIVNKNQYGANTLTDLMKTSINENEADSILIQYLKYEGKLDANVLFTVQNSKQLDNLIEDILMDSAPTVNKRQEAFSKDLYIKVWEDGMYVLKKRVNGKYVEIAFYKNDYGEDEINPTAKAEINRLKYSCLWSTSDSLKIIGNRLLSNNFDIILNTIKGMYGTQNLIIKRNC